MNTNESIRMCKVCGDKAIAKNFCALTCESCKAFFRRNATKIDEFKCIYGNECEINLDTRKRCRKCRLKKCFKIGMRKEWILNEDEKRIRNNKINENRHKKKQNYTQNNRIDIISDQILSENISIDKNILKTSQKNSEYNQINEMCSQISINNNQSLNKERSELVPIMRPLTDYRNNFTEIEGNLLTELLNATKFLTILVSDITYETNTLSEAWLLISSKFDQEIRKMIKTAKSLSAFKNICKSDQVSLLKYCSVEVAYMRSIIAYENQNEYWIVCLDINNATRLNLETFKQRSFENYSESKIFMNKLAHHWDSDQIILHFLMVIILFNPNRPNLIHKHLVKLQQQIYMRLFERYLLIKYGSEVESKSRFSKFMQILCDLHVLHEQQIRQYLNQMPPNFDFFINSPLLKELYDKNSDTLSIEFSSE